MFHVFLEIPPIISSNNMGPFLSVMEPYSVFYDVRTNGVGVPQIHLGLQEVRIIFCDCNFKLEVLREVK